MTRPDYQMISHGRTCDCCIAIASSEVGHQEAWRSPRRHGRSTSHTGLIRCGAKRFSLVPGPDISTQREHRQDKIGLDDATRIAELLTATNAGLIATWSGASFILVISPLVAAFLYA